MRIGCICMLAIIASVACGAGLSSPPTTVETSASRATTTGVTSATQTAIATTQTPMSSVTEHGSGGLGDLHNASSSAAAAGGAPQPAKPTSSLFVPGPIEEPAQRTAPARGRLEDEGLTLISS